MTLITVNKLLLINILVEVNISVLAFGLYDLSSHFLSQYAVFSYPETLKILTMDLIISATFICLVFLPLQNPKLRNRCHCLIPQPPFQNLTTAGTDTWPSKHH